MAEPRVERVGEGDESPNSLFRLCERNPGKTRNLKPKLSQDTFHPFTDRVGGHLKEPDKRGNGGEIVYL